MMIEELVIPDVPDEIVRVLTEQAARNNRTLEEEVKDLLYRMARGEGGAVELEEVKLRLPRRTLVFLRSMAANTGFSLDAMFAEAIRGFVRVQQWKMEEIRKAVEEADQGKFISNEEVEAHLRDLLGEPSPERRAMLKRELGRQMASISEEASCSSWAWRIEDELPPLLEQAAFSQQPVQYQGVALSPLYADWLVSMAVELGHWVTQGDGGEYVPHLPKKASSDIPA
jgi:predicted transcriptional regulator